jgi:flagellar motor switch protein FliM
VLWANIESSPATRARRCSSALPFVVLEKFFQVSGQRRVGVARRERGRARRGAAARREALRATPVTVSARLPEFRMTLRDIGQLQVGPGARHRDRARRRLQVLIGRSRTTGAVAAWGSGSPCASSSPRRRRPLDADPLD